MIALDNVTVRFAGRAAVDNVTLSIARGETVALVGPSGAGKSTVLRLMVGLERAQSGRVAVDGVDPAGPGHLAVQRGIGYVIQDGGLFPHLTARANVTLLARHLGWSRERIDARVDELVSLTQLPRGAVERLPSELSGGQRQRVALMRALMLDPPLLLLDEPLGALDPIVRADLQDALHAIFATLAKTVVLVTHDLVEAAFFAPRIVFLHDGRVAADGSLSSLRASLDPLVARFVVAHRSLPEDGAAAHA